LFSGIELFLDHSERSLVSIVDYWLRDLEWDDHHTLPVVKTPVPSNK
jgi:hypothetical protein